jgi:SAM-dependent methyltransferase
LWVVDVKRRERTPIQENLDPSAPALPATEAMRPTYEDHFSGHAHVYSRHRPLYPERLFAYLASTAPALDLAWDCATGSGQAALGLARHFRRVLATDASAEQIAHAHPHERVTYSVALAEASGLADGSADLIGVAQAVHWFDFPRFYAEVRRVLKPGGVLAAWAYQHTRIDPAVDEILRAYTDETLGPYWPARIQFTNEHYRTIPFPFEELEPPEAFEAEASWDLEELVGYLWSWSAAHRYLREHGRDPYDTIRDALAAAWGPAEQRRAVRWPLHLRIGTVPAADSTRSVR